MKNSKLFTRFITLVTIWSLVIGTGWMLPKDAMARQVHGHTRTNVNHNRNVNRTPISIEPKTSIETPM